MQRVTVVGAGVIGLTCAVRLAEAGVEVDVLARDLPEETTSAVAGGLWLPFLAEPVEAVTRWARTSLGVFTQMADDERTGVRLMPGHLLHRAGGSGVERPDWARLMADVVPLRAEDDPAPGYGFAWGATVPLVDTPRYLVHLKHRLLAAGGTLTRLPLPALPGRGLVVNCTGLASRALADDPLVRPVRGQTLVLADPGLREWWVAEPADGVADGSRADGSGADGSRADGSRADGSRADDLVYVLPRGRDVVVGGTAQDDDWSTTPDPAQARAILDRAAELVPQLRTATILGHRVGLRPVRPSVRLEVERLPSDEDPSHAIVHCYGHGGSGITLSWGCADDVVALVSPLAHALF